MIIFADGISDNRRYTGKIISKFYDTRQRRSKNGWKSFCSTEEKLIVHTNTDQLSILSILKTFISSPQKQGAIVWNPF